MYNKNTKETGCIVQHDTSFKTPDSVHILSYITPKQPMSIGLTYIGRDNNSYRDVVKLSNTEATHRRVWVNGSYTADRHLFPINITKGWNTLTLTAAEDEITLTYLTREDGEVREQRHLNSTIKTIYLEGNFSICSGGPAQRGRSPSKVHRHPPARATAVPGAPACPARVTGVPGAPARPSHRPTCLH